MEKSRFIRMVVPIVLSSLIVLSVAALCLHEHCSPSQLSSQPGLFLPASLRASFLAQINITKKVLQILEPLEEPVVPCSSNGASQDFTGAFAREKGEESLEFGAEQEIPRKQGLHPANASHKLKKSQFNASDNKDDRLSLNLFKFFGGLMVSVSVYAYIF